MISFFSFCLAIVLIARTYRRGAKQEQQKEKLKHRLIGGALVVVGVWFAPTGLILSKTIARALLPLGLLWGAVLLYALVRFVVDDKVGGARAAALVLLLGLVGNEPLGQGMMELLEEPYQADPFAAGSFDAVVVLGGGAQRAPHPGFELGPSGDRVFLGARLWHAGQTPVLVTTGTPIEGFQIPFDSLEATTTMWRSVGVAADAIVPVSGTRTTSEEARACAKLIKERAWKRVGLVTSAWHLRRAIKLFAREGVEVVPLAADHRGTPTWEGLYSVVPTGNGAYLQQKAAWEWIGALVGR